MKRHVQKMAVRNDELSFAAEVQFYREANRQKK